MSSEERGDDSRIVVKKYANRRLYNTATSSYVTLDHLARLTQEGVDFVVYDAKSGDDITRSVLTQIIVEEEAKGENLLPIAFLRQLITFYGDNMRWMVPQYLEHMIQNFAENQDRMRGAMQDAMGNLFPFNNLEDMRKQNMAFFEQAMRVWSPFAAGQKAASPSRSPAQSSGQPPGQPAGQVPAIPPRPPAYTAEPPKAAPSQVELDRLQAEVKSLKAKLADATTPPAAANIQPPAAAESKPVPPVAKPPAASPPAASPPAANPPVAKPPAAEAPAPVPPAPATPKAEPAAAPAPAEAATKPAPKPAPKAAPVRAAKAAPARAPAARRSTAATRRAPKPAASKSDDTKKN